jgi:hypothetical protein
MPRIIGNIGANHHTSSALRNSGKPNATDATGTINLQWYRWDCAIGEVLACAENPTEARRQVMLTLSLKDAARGELEAAIAPEPELVGNTRMAVVAWDS